MLSHLYSNIIEIFTFLLIDLPEQWEDMKGQRVKAVRLQPTSQEYQDVESKFRKTCSNVTIEKVRCN